MIVRIGSHRANAKLRAAIPEMVEVYENSFSKSGYFALVSEEQSAKALAITGISKVRDPDKTLLALNALFDEAEGIGFEIGRLDG